MKELIEILFKSNLTVINIEDTKGKVTIKKEKETEIITPQISQMPVEAASMHMPQVQSTESNNTEAPK
ncbi:acetyl-CoA carboxylase, biotin carboxyl carrier protein, partial [Staphylococcus aureus]|nr:acetyl-CoA carboxylase, biotin carboxyl carrier protein [Staphylococcus aureus]